MYVSNLSWSTPWMHLKDFMGQVGPVLFADIFQDAGGRSKGCGIVTFADPESASRGLLTALIPTLNICYLVIVVVVIEKGHIPK